MDTKSTRNKFFKDIGTFIFLILLIFFSISLIGTVREHRNFKSDFGNTLFDNNLIVSEALELDTVLKEYTILYLDLDGNKKENVYNKRIEESNSYKENSIREAENNIREEAKESNLSEEEIKKQIEEVRASIMSEDGVDNYYSQVMNSANNIIYKNVNIEFFFKDSSGAKVTNIEDNNIEDEIDNNAFLNNEGYYYMYLPSSKLKVNNTFYSDELIDIYNAIRHNNDDVSRFYRIPKELKQGDLLYNISLEREEFSSILYKKIAVTAAFGSLTLIFALVAFRNRKNKTTSYIEDLYNKVPIDIRTLVFVYSLVLTNSLIFNVIPYYGNNYYCNSILLKSCILIALDYYFIKDLILILEKKRTIGKILILKIYKYMLDIIKSNEFIKTNKFKFIFVICLSILALFCLWLESFAYWSYGLMIFSKAYLCIYLIAASILSVIIFRDITILESNALRISKGNYKDESKKGKIIVLKNIENNLNTIEDGLKEALDNAITSEKMKSELITNVSHDLKTPLTSIINYIDLLKEENITDDKRARYIEVLDMKSKRLKILIEDLFEASKAVSGNMNFTKEDLNIVSLLRQVIGELEEKINHSQLDIITKWPEEKVILYLDGRKTFRVYENLLNNIIKYSMKNSRVYIDVINNEDEVIIILKNISAYQIDFSSEEIVERFKRGDKARSTEESGLGLSIAKSIVELQGGEFNIEIDGDLFKVITKFKKDI
ncbi:sensor histidine kinase KdpD [uncultured Clostridium sp.]|uniref:sensor histidine kinase n=1 Tax=uncultured Clostridium sp. TaxID=59620 RepID=UPI0025FD8A8C|nr:sensor histidine kinase [uncultured Clostridium sp.]